MTTAIMALASDVASIPGVREAAAALSEPSAGTVLGVALIGLLAGRALSVRRSHED